MENNDKTALWHKTTAFIERYSKLNVNQELTKLCMLLQ